MTLTTTRVIGQIPLPDGTAPEAAAVVFTLSGIDTDGDATIMPIEIRASVAADGSIDVGLWPNGEGGRGTHYNVTAEVVTAAAYSAAPVKAVVKLGRCVVPATGPVALSDVLVTTGTPVSTQLDALAQAIAAAASAVSAAESVEQAAVDAAQVAKDRAAVEVARDAAFVNAAVYTTVAAGLAGVADGQQFQVAGESGIIRYRRDSASVATEVARYPTASATDALAGSVGTLSAALGQALRELQALASLQAGDAITAGAVAQLISLLGQVAGQVNGGRAALAGGTLADPAIMIGTVGIYSAAANTLSVAISGVERLRVTASGITVYGTVTTD